MLGEFKKFILRGNVVDLAVGVVIGAAFNSVVQSLVKDMITPLITAISGRTQFKDLTFQIHGIPFYYGDFLNTLLSFLIVAAVVFFFVVQPINKLSDIAFKSKKSDDPASKKCPYCLGKIPAEATRCQFCTSKVEAKA